MEQAECAGTIDGRCAGTPVATVLWLTPEGVGVDYTHECAEHVRTVGQPGAYGTHGRMAELVAVPFAGIRKLGPVGWY